MWQLIVGLIAGLAGAIAPAISNLLVGRQTSQNLAYGNLDVGAITTLLTLLGVVMFILGLVQFRGKQMIGALLLIILSPYIAPLLIPNVTPSPPSPTTTTTTTTRPEEIPLANACVYDPVRNCYDQVYPILADFSKQIGSYSERDWGINRPTSRPGLSALIETSCGYRWGGRPFLSSVLLEDLPDCELRKVYVYVISSKYFLDWLWKTFGTDYDVWIILTLWKPGIIGPQKVWEYEYKYSRPSRDFAQVTLVYVLKDDILAKIERVMEPGVVYSLDITYRFYGMGTGQIFGVPIPMTYDNVITLKVAKPSQYQYAYTQPYGGGTTTTTRFTTTTTTATRTPWCETPPCTHALVASPPEVDPLSGVNLLLVTDLLSVSLTFISLLLLYGERKRGRR
ncbi:MAG: hypothetical protein RMJ06_06705 [Nitrososphaerota archaeon]|nr:hypothetical protein [Nitrososphaerota archaeon]